jgi:hypothetical protein
MEEVSSTPVNDPGQPGKSRRRQQVTIMIACVLIATALWFLRALENDYTTRVDHPVRFINIPENMIPLNPVPQRLSLEVSGLGFSVLKHNWNFSKTPLVIDLKPVKPANARGKKGFVETLMMSQYLSDFSSQLKDLKVVSVFPDTLIFRFAVKQSKKLKVIPAWNPETPASLPDSLVLVVPDSVTVEGPDLILDTLHFIRTLPIKPGRSGNSFSRTTGLENLHRLVSPEPVKVTVSFEKTN